MWFVCLICVVTAKRSAILLHTTRKLHNNLSYISLSKCNVTPDTTLTLHSTTLFFLTYTRYKYESVYASVEEQKRNELSLIWIRSESHVNLNRAPRKLYLSLKPTWNETYSKCKWSLFQSQKSLFALRHKQNREGWSPNREGCVRDKFPISGISHVCCYFDYQ